MKIPVRILFLLVIAAPVSAQERSYGRSMVINDRGIVATSHTLASQAGAQVLARGGSAMDAAIAANAALNGVTVAVTTADVLDIADPRWEIVTAGDVCYERPMADRVTAWLRILAARGSLVLQGGVGDNRAIISAFVARAGGPASHVVVIPTASVGDAGPPGMSVTVARRVSDSCYGNEDEGGLYD